MRTDSKQLAGIMASKYCPEDIAKAIAEVHSGTSVRGAAEKFGIPKSTLHDHIKGVSKSTGAGGPTVLSRDVEREIVLACTTLAEMGYGVTRDLVEHIVSQYLLDNDIPNPFVGGAPGRDWWERFRKRWPCLSERKPQNLSRKRAKAGDPDIINAWFDNLDKVFANIAFDPYDPLFMKNRLWNCDETAFSTCPTSTRILAKRGSRAVHEIGGDSGHQYITVHCCGSASGELLPPFILYKGKNMYKRWIEGGPAGALYGVSDSGWMDAANYLSWFKKLFLPAVSHLTKRAPVILLQDGHHSHISIELILARANHVVLLCLPPNTTHLLQPLDIGVFAPMKKAWKKILKQYKLETGGQKVTKEIFPSLVTKLWEVSSDQNDLCGGFRGAGLVPYSRSHVLKKLPLAGESASQREGTGTVARECTSAQTTAISCTECGHQMPVTPVVRVKVVAYFADILRSKTEQPKLGERNNLKIRVEGEAITSDEFETLLEEQIKERKKKKKQKKSSSRFLICLCTNLTDLLI